MKKKSNACRFLHSYALKWYEVRCLRKLFRGSNFVQKCGPSYKNGVYAVSMVNDVVWVSYYIFDHRVGSNYNLLFRYWRVFWHQQTQMRRSDWTVWPLTRHHVHHRGDTSLCTSWRYPSFSQELPVSPPIASLSNLRRFSYFFRYKKRSPNRCFRRARFDQSDGRIRRFQTGDRN